jgi:hypothetical protein
LFDRMLRYLECTYLAIRFSLTGRLRFLDAPTVVWTEYGGLSQSPAFRVGQPAALEEMLALPLPPAFRRGLERHLTEAYHSVAEFYRQRLTRLGRPPPIAPRSRRTAVPRHPALFAATVVAFHVR